MVFPIAGFPPVFPKKRLELKSLKGQTKTEEERTRSPVKFVLSKVESMVFSTARFPPVFPEKRLELKSLKGQTKAEEGGVRGPFLLSLRLSLKAL